MLVPKTIHWIIGLLLVFGFTFYIGLQVIALARNPILVITNPKVFHFVTNQDTIIVKGNVTQKSQVFLNGEEITVDEHGFFEKTIILVSGENILNFKAVNRRGKQTYMQREIVRE